MYWYLAFKFRQTGDHSYVIKFKNYGNKEQATRFAESIINEVVRHFCALKDLEFMTPILMEEKIYEEILKI